METLSIRDIASKIVLSGHCGGRLGYENTLTAFRKAIEHNIPEIEFDIWLTKDLVPIIVHGTEEGTIGSLGESIGVHFDTPL